MGLELPKGLADLQTKKEMPEITELSREEKAVSDRAREILAGNQRAYENLLDDAMLDPGFQERQLNALKNLQLETLKVIENLKDRFPDGYANSGEYRKTA